MWAVGWTRRTRQPGLLEDTNGITILNTRRRKPLSGSAVTKEWRSTSEDRSRLDAKVYLAYVDDDEHLDLCQVETLHEQICQGVDRGCVTQQHGSTILSTTQLYNPSTHLFERYEMSKHKGCNAEFDFAKRDGFLLMQTQGRVGFLPSPLRLNEDEDDSLDLY